jgi:hypothetical protein
VNNPDLISAYYMVARDLEWRASTLHEMGKNCFEIADRLSEQGIKRAGCHECGWDLPQHSPQCSKFNDEQVITPLSP